MDMELSNACAKFMFGLYSGGMSGPYQTFATPSYLVEYILVDLTRNLF